MENQQSINSILSFGAKSVDPQLLETLLIGREKTADHLFSAIRSIADDQIDQHILIVGQRGMGKTHLLRILHHRSQQLIQQQKLVIAYFSEEEYGVASFFDFLIRIINAFIRWDQSSAEMLHAKMEELRDARPESQTQLAENIIAAYTNGKPLLILAENLADILESIGGKGQHKLRAWLYQTKRISIIATSQSLGIDFDREDRPFYGFFSVRYLKPLSYEDSYKFLLSLAKNDGRTDIIDHIKNKGSYQVRAIHQLVKGNHRLLVTFYEFLKGDTLAKLSSNFIKTINDLKPYYETYIRYLPPQQQKILRYIALSRKPQQGIEIQRNCFIDQKSLSKQLSELVKKHLLESIADPSDKRNKFYDIEEPLLRISIEVGEHKEGITALFIDFLALYYEETELKNKIEKVTDLLALCKEGPSEKEFLYEINAIHRALDIQRSGEKNDDDTQAVLGKIYTAIFSQDYILANTILNEDGKKLNKEFRSAIEGFTFFMQNDYTLAINALKNVSISTLKSSGLAWVAALAYANLAIDTNDLTLYQTAIPYFEAWESSDLFKKLEAEFYYIWGHLTLYFALVQEDEDLYNKGVEKFQLAVALNKKKKKYLEQLALYKFGYHSVTKDRKGMIESFQYLNDFIVSNSDREFIMPIWGKYLSLAMSQFRDMKTPVTQFIDQFKKLSHLNRHKTLEKFGELNEISFLLALKDLINEDILEKPGQLTTVLLRWTINILSSKQNTLSADQLKEIREMISAFKQNVPEFNILNTYIDLYEKVILNKDESALFDLPKEQREFFLEKIAGRNPLSE